MDYVARQFINLIKKFRKELPKLTNSLRNDIKQQTEAIREARNTYDQGRNTPPILRAELQVPHSIEVQTSPKKNKTGREWYKLVIETLTFLGVLAYAIVTVRIWREMISARHIAQTAIIEAKQSADKSLAQVQANFIADQRPYIWLSAQQMYILPNAPIVGSVFIANYGKTPAIRQRMVGQVLFGPQALSDADNWFNGISASYWKEHTSGESILPPGIPPDPKKTMSLQIHSKGLVSAAEYNWIISHDYSVIAVMRIQYSDTSGTQYWTDICTAQIAGHTTSGADCPRHNEIH